MAWTESIAERPKTIDPHDREAWVTRRLIGAVCLATAIAMRPGYALDFQDSFDTPYDYVNQDVAGSAWYGLEGRDAAVHATASIDDPGQLFLASKGPISPSFGVLLFCRVLTDFVVSVRVTDFAATPDLDVAGNRGGLLVRADGGGPGGQDDDWLALDYAPSASGGNGIRQADSGLARLVCSNNQAWQLEPYLQIERINRLLHCRTSTDGVNWHDLPCSPVMREDLADGPLQIGLYVASTPAGGGFIAFDDFSIREPSDDNGLRPLRAYNPSPAVGADNVTFALLSWQPGRTALSHQIWLGTAPDALSLVADGIDRDTTWWHVSDGFEQGVTYYWRVDEMTSDGEITGDLWFFSVPAPHAHSPFPPEGQEDVVENNLTLSWKAGQGGIWHDVYLSTQSGAVMQGASSAYKGRTADTRYSPDTLLGGTTYYWRAFMVLHHHDFLPGV